MRTAVIYAWICPDTGAVVYVGKTSMTLDRRMANHLGGARRHPKTKKDKWLAELLSRGLRPEVEILEEVAVETSSEAEKRWAATFRPSGLLLNDERVGGGNPGIGRVEWTPELLSLLGKVADSKIARMLRCHRKTVSYKRECLGIPASFDRTDNVPPPNNSGWNKIDLPEACIAKLGKFPDYVLAGEFGVSKPVIRRVRVSMGISDYAATTGNDGKIQAGDPHPRWGTRRSQQEKALEFGLNYRLPDEVWEGVRHLFPRPIKLGKALPERAVLTTILRVMASGLKWIDVPEDNVGCSGITAYGRLKNMVERGQWAPIESKLKAMLPDPDLFDWSRAGRNYYRKSTLLKQSSHEATLFDDR